MSSPGRRRRPPARRSRVLADVPVDAGPRHLGSGLVRQANPDGEGDLAVGIELLEKLVSVGELGAGVDRPLRKLQVLDVGGAGEWSDLPEPLGEGADERSARG